MFTLKQHAKQLLSIYTVSKQIFKKQLPPAIINHKDYIPDYDLDANPVKLPQKFMVSRVLINNDKSNNILNGD